MGAAHLKMIARRLLEQGHPADTTVLLGYNVSLSDEQFFTTTLQLLSTSDHRYPTPLIAMIGDVAALRRHKAEEIQRVLYTGTVCNTPHTLHTPLIEIAPMADRSGIVSSVRHLHEYDYLLFTSRYAVKYWFEALHSENLDTKYLKGVTIISIGDITSQALRDEGVKQILQTEQEDSCGIIELFRPLETGKVLIPRSDLALQIIPDGLRKLGYEVTTVTAYHNRCPEHPLKANLKHIRKIIFTSPSTVDNFIRVYDSLPDGIPMETRGRTTEEHLKAKQYSNEKI
jgi:uroporphyrinogen III methyltransferase/synthase